MNALILISALIIDFFIGDPPKIPHPVILIGKLITKLEAKLYPKAKSSGQKLVAGSFLVLLVLSFTYLITWLLVHTFSQLDSRIGLVMEIWLISTTIAVKGLKEAGEKIRQLLAQGKIREARIAVGYIVGRDTDQLSAKEIIRATIETIAENIVDAITSPLFYAFLGGAPLAMTYRAVNTLDSMLGYRNEKYLYFGRTAARVDDFFNFIPARLTGLFLVIISFLLPGFSGENSLKILTRDRRQHPSPNSGYCESAVAGALKVRLGGLNYYQKQPSRRPFIGDAMGELNLDKIQKTIKLMLTTALVWTISLTIVQVFLK